MDSSADDHNKRKQFGNRYLTDESQVFEHNAWDDVPIPTKEFVESVETKIRENSENKLSVDRKDELDMRADFYWDQFYGKHENKFFKDRHWLFTEFPELKLSDNDNEHKILELGCGVGNTVFPVLQINSNPNLFVYCCDFSPTAVDLLKENPLYDPTRCQAFVLDLTSDEWSVPFAKSSLTAVTMIFVLSAIDPKRMQAIVDKVSEYLRPGGHLLFRDYGRYDMTQVRFKAGHCIDDNFYVRGDGTRAYFFTEQEVEDMFAKAGLQKVFVRSDKRLQVNRLKRVRMYRVWIQAKYQK